MTRARGRHGGRHRRAAGRSTRGCSSRARRRDRRRSAAVIAERRPRHVVFTARGHLRPRRALRGVPHRDPARPARPGSPRPARSPSTAPAPTCPTPWSSGSSQSGGSPDLAEVLRVARESGALTLAVTNDPDSPLAQAAELSHRRRRRARAGGRRHQDLHRRAARAADARRGRPRRRRRAARRRARPRWPRCPSWPRATLADADRGRAGRALPVRRPAGHHRPGLRLPDRPGGRAEADGDLVPAGAGVLRRRPAARPARHDRPGRAGARRGRLRPGRRGRCARC